MPAASDAAPADGGGAFPSTPPVGGGRPWQWPEQACGGGDGRFVLDAAERCSGDANSVALYRLKARSRKHPGLAKRQNRFHTTKDRRERHEHLLIVSSDKRATRLRHKATYTYATVSPHQKRVLVLFPPLFHPHHRAATVGAPYNRPCAISVAQTTRVDGADQRGDRGGRRPPPPPRLHELLRAWRPMQASHPPRRRGTRRRRPPRRRAPTGPPSAARPRVRGGGGALLPHRPRDHARRLGAGGGAGCSRPGCPCLICRRGGRRVSAAAATWGGGGADAAAAAITAQWGLDRVPYGSADSVLQAVAGYPQSAKWLLVGAFCAGSLLV